MRIVPPIPKWNIDKLIHPPIKICWIAPTPQLNYIGTSHIQEVTLDIAQQQQQQQQQPCVLSNGT